VEEGVGEGVAGVPPGAGEAVGEGVGDGVPAGAGEAVGEGVGDKVAGVVAGAGVGAAGSVVVAVALVVSTVSRKALEVVELARSSDDDGLLVQPDRSTAEASSATHRPAICKAGLIPEDCVCGVSLGSVNELVEQAKRRTLK
jgi:hypothetical protein